MKPENWFEPTENEISVSRKRKKLFSDILESGIAPSHLKRLRRIKFESIGLGDTDRKAYFDIKASVGEVLDALSVVLKRGDAEFVCGEGSIGTVTEIDSVLLILAEAVNNALLYSSDGRVTVELYKVSGQIFLVVENKFDGRQIIEGRGISAIKNAARNIGGRLFYIRNKNRIKMCLAIPEVFRGASGEEPDKEQLLHDRLSIIYWGFDQKIINLTLGVQPLRP